MLDFVFSYKHKNHMQNSDCSLEGRRAKKHLEFWCHAYNDQGSCNIVIMEITCCMRAHLVSLTIQFNYSFHSQSFILPKKTPHIIDNWKRVTLDQINMENCSSSLYSLKHNYPRTPKQNKPSALPCSLWWHESLICSKRAQALWGMITTVLLACKSYHQVCY